ncbi:hypothetical protein BCR32DRAFT_293444 [Anaeromyces robustus]|uniref:EGF-like domain-containing protein n=1 Tax=Anaeromyces robustus TaxID=1754192 RepID=A0A1Y1X5N9_9FUNG|nr:hypothetical protein BCR32DRAFT_293444 [Anaeromyces robustus]|eukprot:ORX81129.1 hypothetical protein BCR32DRAFT_293444 [Anaeromyces robustus]
MNQLLHIFCVSIYFIFIIVKVFTKEIIIRNVENDLSNLKTIVQENQRDGELILKFIDNYYNMTLVGYEFAISVESNISFIGNINGTIFDFNNDRKGRISIFSNGDRKDTIKMENLIFKNYSVFGGMISGAAVFYIASNSINNFYIFKNCTFINITHNIFNGDIRCGKQDIYEPNILISNCKFYNNTEKLFRFNGNPNYSYTDMNKCLKIKIKDSYFDNNRGLFSLQNTYTTIDNCYFTKIQKNLEEKTKGALFHSESKYEYLSIINSKFENIDIIDNIGLIYGEGLSLEIKNTTFDNCYSNSGFLFDIYKHYDDKKITIENTTFSKTSSLFQGDSCKYNITNSTFENINIKNSNPFLSNSKYSFFSISDTIFKNISLESSLFGEESTYNINNVELENIKSNSKALLYFLYKNISINNLNINNITCNGDNGYASFLLFDSGEELKNLTINNLKAENSLFNGSFIKIKGETNDISLKDSIITNNISYGSIIKNTSKKTKTVINNVKFSNNHNKSKYDCGSIYFENNIDISITNSVFKNNVVRENGGAIALDGGAIYLADNSNDNNNGNNNNITSINMENNIFEKNHAENFGGAICTKYKMFYLAKFKNNTIKNNNAGILGGGVFTQSIMNKNIIDQRKVKFINNTISNLVENYVSEPSYITLVNSNSNQIITGDYFPLIFTLYDAYGNIVQDVSKYYSSITLRLELKLKKENNTNDKNKESKIFLIGNLGSFVNGKCDFNNLRIYAEPNIYTLNLYIDNYNGKIDLRFDDIIINVNDCNEFQIKKYDHRGFYYCENPICRESCPTLLSYYKKNNEFSNNEVSAICKPYNRSLPINDIDKNICICLPGWSGYNCDTKIYVNFDNIFLTYTTYIKCSLNYLLKHIGISLSETTLYIMVTLNFELGKGKSYIRRESTKFKFDINNENNNESKIIKSNVISNESPLNMEVHVIKNDISLDSILFENDLLIKKIKKVTSFFIEVYIIYIIYIIFLISSIFYCLNINNIEEVQNHDGIWSFKCILEEHDLFLNSIDFIVLIVITFKGNRTLQHECVFNYTKYITYSSMAGLLLGPIINIISYSTLNGEQYRGNNPWKYFIFKKHEECLIHHSEFCGCGLNIPRDNLNIKIIIRNGDYNYLNLKSFIKDNQYDGELILKFIDNYYDMTVHGFELTINVESNISFIGNINGTVFDFNYDRRGQFLIQCIRDKGDKLTFENIIFENYRPNEGIISGASILYINSFYINFYIIFKNCTFRNTFHNIISIDTNCGKQDNYEPNLIITNCNFYDNTERLIIINENPNYLYIDKNKCFKVKIKDSYFNNNRGLFVNQNSYTAIENCYFTNIQKDFNERTKGAFFHSESKNEYLSILNTKFENIDITSNIGLIHAEGLSLEITNTTFTNCYSKSGFLFDIYKHPSNKKIIIKNAIFSKTSSLFQGDSCKYDIMNSIFEDIKVKNSNPFLSNSKYSDFLISNTVFNNISLEGSLFGEESTYYINNVNLENIKSNSKAVLYFLYKNISINNLNIKNITCNGDDGYASFLLFDSGEEMKKLTINNFYAKDGLFNDSFIKIRGETNEISLNDSTIKNIISYGSIIKNESKKTISIINNVNFKDNINHSKYECGSIYFENNIDISITNSYFKNNHIKDNGGAICLKRIMNLKFNLNSNYFNLNKALDGGAIYLTDNINNNNNNNNELNNNYTTDINIENNIFNKNYAKNFGGAICSSYKMFNLIKFKNNTIKYNDAGIMGGGIFSQNIVNKNIIDQRKIKFINNTVSSSIENYTSEPSYITLLNQNSNNVITGDYYPIVFTLYDAYDNVIKDVTKYYSTIMLRLVLIHKHEDNVDDDKKENEINDYSKYKKTETFLTGNTGSFLNGKCEFKNLKLYAVPDIYILKLYIDNYNGKIDLRFDDIIIKINDCDENQIKKYDNHGLYYCEDPICRESCPTTYSLFKKKEENIDDIYTNYEVSAICKPYNRSLPINDPNKNICSCLPGWDGYNCDTKIYISFRNIYKEIVIVVILIVMIIMTYIVFITIKRKKDIIVDIGYKYIFLFSLGISIYFISNLFLTYTTYTECSLNYIFKHIGISLSEVVLYTMITLNFEIGTSKHVMKGDDTIMNSGNFESTFDESSLIIKSNISIIRSEDRKMENNKTISANEYNADNIIKKRIKKISSFYIELVLIYGLYLIFMLYTSIYNINTNNIKEIQDYSGKWSYQCVLEKYDLFLNSIELTVFIVMIYKGNRTLQYECVFSYTKNITYSSITGVLLGPLINVFGYTILDKEQYSKTILNLTFNSFCYFLIFIQLSWDNIYYIIKNQDIPWKYFIFRTHEECLVHHSFSCGCKLEMKKKEFETNIHTSINSYKIYSKYFEKRNGKIKFIDTDTKIKYLNIQANK